MQDTPTCRPEVVKEIAGGFVRLGEKATEVLRRLKERPGFSGALVEALPLGNKDRDLDAIAGAIFDDYSAKKQRMPGIGHRTHAEGDPWAEALFKIAKQTRAYHQYCELIQKLSKLAGERRKSLIPVNVTAPSRRLLSTWLFRGKSLKPLH
jgi:citrate synthase